MARNCINKSHYFDDSMPKVKFDKPLTPARCAGSDPHHVSLGETRLYIREMQPMDQRPLDVVQREATLGKSPMAIS